MNFNFEFYLWRSNCVSVSMDRQTDRRTDRQTDELIWGRLGNLRFLQVNRYPPETRGFLFPPKAAGSG